MQPDLRPEEYLKIMKDVLAEKGDPQTAEGQMRYMRDQFEYYGLKAAQWLGLAKEWFKTYGFYTGPELITFCRLCYEEEHREMQYLAIEMLQKGLKQQPEEGIELIEELILAKSWWDTVDWLAKLAGIHLDRYPHLIVPRSEQWMNSNNIWLQRTALIFQRFYKEKTNEKMLFDYILRLQGSKEFFIQKGAGWALRQYSRTAPDAVRQFISKHSLAPLTQREGMKWIIKKGL